MFFMAVVCCVLAKPTVIAYSAPILAEPASALVESTYHGVSGFYAAAPAVYASPYLSAYSAYPAYATTLLR